MILSGQTWHACDVCYPKDKTEEVTFPKLEEKKMDPEPPKEEIKKKAKKRRRITKKKEKIEKKAKTNEVIHKFSLSFANCLAEEFNEEKYRNVIHDMMTKSMKKGKNKAVILKIASKEDDWGVGKWIQDKFHWIYTDDEEAINFIKK